MPIPIIKNFLLFEVTSSCNIPQIFFPSTNTSFGNFRFMFPFSQKCLITLEIKMGFIIENSLKGGYSFFKGKNIELNKFPLSEIHFLP